MPNTYTWDCRTVDAYPSYTSEGITESNVIYNVHWIITGSDGTNQAKVIGTQELEVSDLSSFTPVADLTNDDVVAWTKAAIGQSQIDILYRSLDQRLSEMENPTTELITIGN
jgi:hypothetical protein